MLVMHVDIYLVHACEYREVIHNPVPTATNIDDWYIQSQWHTSSWSGRGNLPQSVC